MIPKHKNISKLIVFIVALLILRLETMPHSVGTHNDPAPAPAPASASTNLSVLGASIHLTNLPIASPDPMPTTTSDLSLSPTISPSPSPTPLQPGAPTPVRPVRSNTPDIMYSALPYTSATVTTAGGSNGPWWLSTIHTPVSSPAGPSTVIAVIDTGFALNHKGLTNRWWTNNAEMGPTSNEGPTPNCTSRGLALDKSCNNLDNDGDGYPSDWRGWDFANNDNSPLAGTTSPTSSAVSHATFVTGLIASSITSSSGGVDINARIMPLQALTDGGRGTTSTVADAIIYAADHNAGIINLSLGSSSDDSYLHQAIAYAIAKGSVVVAAAGNDGCDCMLYPANYPEVIGVGASTSTDNLAVFSSFGANLDLIAPGQDLCSTTWLSTDDTSAYACGGAGTSFATPLVAGALSRLISSGISTKVAGQFLGIAADKTTAMNGAWRTLQSGTGRIDIASAITDSLSAQHLAQPDSTIKFTCSGNLDCAITVSNSQNQVTIISKIPTGLAVGVYWNSGSVSSNPSVWAVSTPNSNLMLYYAAY